MSVPPSRPLSICVIAPNAHGVLTNGASDHIGGIERRIAIEARELVRRGHTTSVITWGQARGRRPEVEGVRLLAMCAQEDGIPGLRFAHPRWTSLVRCLERAEADVYYTGSADAVLGQVALWCRHKSRGCLFAVASDSNCVKRPSHLTTRRHRIMYLYGLLRADRVVVQTRQQGNLLRREFGRDSQFVTPMTEGPSPIEYVAPALDLSEPLRVAWLGRFSPEKRLEWLLDLAEQRPAIGFEVAGDENQSTAYGADLWRRATRLANVRLHGRLPYAQAKELIRSSQLVCCSSVFEGFPNTLLEAWSLGVPVVSTVDPDGVIEDQGLGAVAADREGLIRGLDRLLESPERWQRASERCRRRYLEHHTVAVGLDQLESALREIAR